MSSVIWQDHKLCRGVFVPGCNSAQHAGQLHSAVGAIYCPSRACCLIPDSDSLLIQNIHLARPVLRVVFVSRMTTRPPVTPYLPAALPFDIIRSSLKDLEYVSELFSALHAVAADFVPNAVLSSPAFSDLLEPASRLLYTAATLCRVPRRTPGDEYVGLLPVRGSPLAPLTRVGAFALAILSATGPAAVIKCGRFLWYKILALRNVQRQFPAHSTRALISFLGRGHLAAFYIFGTYYAISNRVLAVRLVRTAPPSVSEGVAGRYWLLGFLLVFQLASGVGSELRSALAKLRRRRNGRRVLVNNLDSVLATGRELVSIALYPDEGDSEGTDSDGDEGENLGRGAAADGVLDLHRPIRSTTESEGRVERTSGASDQPARRCTLCLGRLKTATLTTCGHVFCWKCVANWCATNEACPLCRHPLQIHRDLFALSNF